MELLDTNVLLDIFTLNPIWYIWSESQLRLATVQKLVTINPLIYAEFAPAFPSENDLDRWLDPTIFKRLPLPYEAGWLASQAFRKYRKSGGTKTSPMPDFYIGAYAEVANIPIVTRDPGRFRTYFPNVVLITPP